jgi:hypothetical protein
MTATPGTRRAAPENHSSTAVGLTVTAAVLMILTGVLQAIEGFVALANDTFYVVGAEYVFELDVTVWGWIHLVLGIVAAFAGVALLQGATWARVVAVLMACGSIVAHFMWLPYYPVWSLILITFNAFVIWAVTAHGRDIVET